MLADDKTIDGIDIDKLSKGSTKKVKLICDSCGKESITNWNNYVQSQRKRNWTGETHCQPCAVRQTAKNNIGKSRPSTSERNRKLFGEQHPSWKGGRYVDRHGYIMVNVKSGRNESESGWNNYRKEHVVVMEKEIGRKINGRKEVVHHIDGQKTNNLISNLWLTDFSGHKNAHNSLQILGYQLIRKGLIVFDKNTGEYVADDKLRELLGHPDEGNQQPSLSGNALEGSETRCESKDGQ